MKEIGMLYRQIDSALNRQGHMHGFMVVDAGFPCRPRGSGRYWAAGREKLLRR